VALSDSSRKRTLESRFELERRVDVDQVGGGIGQVATQNVEGVAAAEDAGGKVGHRSPASSSSGGRLSLR
jgi:hypothetical protein